MAGPRSRPALFALYPLDALALDRSAARLPGGTGRASGAAASRRSARSGGLLDGVSGGALLELAFVSRSRFSRVLAWRRFGAAYGRVCARLPCSAAVGTRRGQAAALGDALRPRRLPGGDGARRARRPACSSTSRRWPCSAPGSRCPWSNGRCGSGSPERRRTEKARRLGSARRRADRAVVLRALRRRRRGRLERAALLVRERPSRGSSSTRIMLGFALLIARGTDLRETFALRRPRSWGRAAWQTALALVAIWALGAALSPVLKAGEEQGFVPDEWQSDKAIAFAANVVVVALVGPVVEELLFRGLGYSLVAAVFGVAAAVIVTAIAFAGAHGLLEGLPILFAFGVAVALLRRATLERLPVHRAPLRLQRGGARRRRHAGRQGVRPRFDELQGGDCRQRPAARRGRERAAPAGRRAVAAEGGARTASESTRTRERALVAELEQANGGPLSREGLERLVGTGARPDEARAGRAVSGQSGSSSPSTSWAKSSAVTSSRNRRNSAGSRSASADTRAMRCSFSSSWLSNSIPDSSITSSVAKIFASARTASAIASEGRESTSISWPFCRKRDAARRTCSRAAR